MSFTLDCTSAPFLRCGRNHIVLTVASVVVRNANEAMVGSGGIYVWLNVVSGARFCVAAVGRNMVSFAMEMFSHSIFINKYV
jgi:hypothetical protein